LFFSRSSRAFFGKQRPVRRRVHHNRFELSAKQAALLVLLVDEHEDGVLQRGLADGHRARERMQHADLIVSCAVAALCCSSLAASKQAVR
jgi:hypothetical protein